MFLSHTSELCLHPPERSFWTAARDAAERARYTVITMEHFPASPDVPAHVCEREVRAADVYVLVTGFRYGSTVADRNEISYTELEFETAITTGKKPIVFLVDDQVPLPRAARDEDLARQSAFRRRIKECGLTIKMVLSPDNLETELFHALTDLGSTPWTRDRYLDELTGRYRTLDLDLMCPRPVTDGSPTLLEQIFVPPNTRADQSPAELPKDVRRRLIELATHSSSGLDHEFDGRDVDPQSPPRVEYTYFSRDPVPALEVLADRAAQRVVVLGDMGAGKSTLLRFLTLLFSGGLGPDAHGAARESFRWMSDWLPVLVELSQYQDAPAGTGDGLVAQLAALNARANIHLPPEVLTDHLSRGGNVVVMLDGLDEVSDSGARRELVRRITSFTFDHPGVRMIVTSRTTGFLGGTMFAGAGFSVITLQDFTSKQIIDFTYRWHFPLLSSGRTTVDQNEQLSRAISESPSLRDLAGNPLLLTILAFMNGRRELPKDRFGVYGYAIDVLAWHWDANRAVRVGARTIDHIKEDAIRELLRQVARRIQDSAGGIGANRMGRSVLLAEIERYLHYRFEQPLKEAAADAARILDQLRDRNFLLTEFEPGVYGFVHRAVLEYCVADELLNRPAEVGSTTTLDDVVRSAFRRSAHDPAWQEVLLLVASKVSPPLRLSVLEQLAADAGTVDDFAPEDRLRLLSFGLRCIRETAASPSAEIDLRNRLESELVSALERNRVDLINDLDIIAPALRELEAIARSNADPLLTSPDRALELPPWLGTYATGHAAITEVDEVLSVLRLGIQFKGTIPLPGISRSKTERAADRTDRPTMFHQLRSWSPLFRRKDR